MTPADGHPDVPRSEHPRPQFVRDRWLCLNGEWQFEVDHGDSGLERGLRERPLEGRITVPFCPEAPLSGIGDSDFMSAVWYRRTVSVPEEWRGSDVLLHFQAVDYDATVWVDGVEVGRHRGGFTPFTCDISAVARPGDEVVVVVRARDDHRAAKPKGKQSTAFGNAGCTYTRTTGIWQTVWLEAVPTVRLLRPRITPSLGTSTVHLDQRVSESRPGWSVRAVLRDGAGDVADAVCPLGLDFAGSLALRIPDARVRPWSPADPHLYDLDIELRDAAGEVVDRARSYAGLRGVARDGKRLLLNGQPVFQRLVLDQGYWPDGIMTAPSDEALVHDIRLSQAAGFNGARLHQKVFEERFLYHADRLGYLVWGEFGDWGWTGEGRTGPDITMVTQWLEALERDHSHPSIVGWCPLNETLQQRGDAMTALDDATRGLFLAARTSDVTRPVIDVSGFSHRVRESDVYDSHEYEADPARLAANVSGILAGSPPAGINDLTWSVPYAGQPYMVSEFGGTRWTESADPTTDPIWTSGAGVATVDEFHERFAGQCAALLDNPDVTGYCYTQLTDVFQEQNGLYSFSRRPKFDIDRLRRAQQRPAAIEGGASAQPRTPADERQPEPVS